MKAIGDLTSKRSEVRALEKEKAWPDEKQFPESLDHKVFIRPLNGPLSLGIPVASNNYPWTYLLLRIPSSCV